MLTWQAPLIYLGERQLLGALSGEDMDFAYIKRLGFWGVSSTTCKFGTIFIYMRKR